MCLFWHVFLPNSCIVSPLAEAAPTLSSATGNRSNDAAVFCHPRIVTYGRRLLFASRLILEMLGDKKITTNLASLRWLAITITRMSIRENREPTERLHSCLSSRQPDGEKRNEDNKSAGQAIRNTRSLSPTAQPDPRRRAFFSYDLRKKEIMAKGRKGSAFFDHANQLS